MRPPILAILGLSLTHTARAWDADLFPAPYETVLQNHVNEIPLKQSVELINDAVTVGLAKTVTCLNTLTAVEGEKCFTMASTYVASSSKSVSSFIEQRFRNLFIPGYAKKTLGMMLFDQSFKYWAGLGFHPRNMEVVLECAKRFCTANATDIATELKKVSEDFDASIGPKVAGRNYDINWKPMIDIYNKHLSTDIHTDNYNIWMPGELTSIDAVWPDVQTFHNFNFNTTEVQLREGEEKSWFTAAKLGALHHFHYYFLFGPDRIFATAASNKPIAEFLERAQEMLGPDLLETLDQQDTFIESIAKPRLSVGGTMTAMGHFQVKLHTYGKLFMLHRSNSYKTFIKKLATRSTWYSGEGGLAYLGYEQTEKRLVHMDVFVKCITSIRFILWIRYLEYHGQLIFMLVFVVLPLVIMALFFMCFVCKSLQCFCRGMRCCMSCCAWTQDRRCWCLWKINAVASDSYESESEYDEESEYEDEEK